MADTVTGRRQTTSISTVGRARSIRLDYTPAVREFTFDNAHLFFNDSLECYKKWPTPAVIVSDGGYGILGFEGDTFDHKALPAWYEPHIQAWSEQATAATTLWFWNSEIGWAAVHPILEKYGWQYVNCNIWNKGLAHIAGNVNTAKIRRFPVVSEVCVQYVKDASVRGHSIKDWLVNEWKRTGLPFRLANQACGVKDAATRKYLTKSHLWYFPPAPAFSAIAEFANKHGKPEGRPYFSLDGLKPAGEEEWSRMRTFFNCPHGVTNVWNRPPLNGIERIKTAPNGKAVHLNQKPMDLFERIILASSAPADVVWEPFGGLFTAAFVAMKNGRSAYAAEIDETYYYYGVNRFKEDQIRLVL